MGSMVGICNVALVAAILACTSVRAEESGPDVGMWDRFEVALTNTASYSSPYTGVDLSVVYTRPDHSTVEFWGFYDGGTTWKARMMCDALGQWTYKATFSDGEPGKSGAFTCVPSDIPGLLTQDQTNPRWLGFKSGKHVLIRSLHVGDRFFASNWPEARRTDFLNWASGQGYNMLSISSFLPNRMEEDRGKGWDTPMVWPLDAAEYRKMESILNLLEDRQIMIYAFAGFFGKLQDNVPKAPDDQERYVRYVMARLGPYWNLLMNVMGPELNRDPSVDRLGALVQRYNVFDHPLGLHTFSHEYGPIRTKPWSSYMVVQGLKKVSTANPVVDLDFTYNGLLDAYAPGKPVYAQETFWPGNHNMPDYTNDEIRKVGYITLMAGAALNFGDMNGISSSGYSGTMDPAQRVQSRHDIIKKVWDFFETVPFYRMNPMPGLVNNGYCLAEPGQDYLVYLPKQGRVNVNLSAGSYRATWINAANTSDVRDSGVIADGLGLESPASGEDWLLRLVRTDDIPDPPAKPKIAFTQADQTQNEGVGAVTVTVELSRASDKPVSVPVFAEGTAQADQDYVLDTDTLTIAAGQTSATLSLDLVDDENVEDRETLTLTLGQPTNADLDSPSSHTLTIVDDDQDDEPPPPELPVVSFGSSQSRVSESGRRQRLMVRLSHPSDVTVIVPVQYQGSARRDGDYRAYNNVTIPAGDTERRLSIGLIDNDTAEPDETVVITLGTPSNATLGSPSTHTLTITDDD